MKSKAPHYHEPVERTDAYDAILAPAERIEGRPFTDPERTESDASVMTMMLDRERAFARTWAPDGGAASVREREDGRREWLVVPDTAALLGASDITAIGFFGQARDIDHTPLFELEEEVADSFPAYGKAGLLSYYDLALDEGSYGFGNLILFSTREVPQEWYSNTAHGRAVAISPGYYHSIRLHKGSIPGPFLGNGELTIERTKYFDFAGEPAWRSLRVFVADD